MTLLREAGHDVLTVSEAGLETRGDRDVLRAARAADRLLLTRNGSDFEALHEADPAHRGIVVVYQDHDPRKNMSYRAIVQALADLEAPGWDLAGQFVPLNAWNFASYPGNGRHCCVYRTTVGRYGTPAARACSTIVCQSAL